MPIQFSVLASGSRGNSTLIRAGHAGLLIDFGLGPRTLAARLEGTIRQLGQQLSAQTPALPVVNDGHGDLGCVPVLGIPDVAGDAHAAPVGLIHRAECLVVVVVDVGEDAQLRR